MIPLILKYPLREINKYDIRYGKIIFNELQQFNPPTYWQKEESVYKYYNFRFISNLIKICLYTRLTQAINYLGANIKVEFIDNTNSGHTEFEIVVNGKIYNHLTNIHFFNSFQLEDYENIAIKLYSEQQSEVYSYVSDIIFYFEYLKKLINEYKDEYALGCCLLNFENIDLTHFDINEKVYDLKYLTVAELFTHFLFYFNKDEYEANLYIAKYLFLSPRKILPRQCSYQVEEASTINEFYVYNFFNELKNELIKNKENLLNIHEFVNEKSRKQIDRFLELNNLSLIDLYNSWIKISTVFLNDLNNYFNEVKEKYGKK